MALTKTQFVIQGSPIDPAFRGSPQEFFEHILERMAIVAPFGVNTFVVGSVQPTSNQGPWLKDGLKWYVWDDAAKTYIPVDVSDSLVSSTAIQSTQPTDPNILFWAETDAQGRVIQLWIKSGPTFYALTATWGTTANRPVNPADYRRYWDVDISCELIWERGKWRTVSGVPGDIKFVTHRVLSDALRYNPGWVEIGSSTIGPSARGRALVPAHKDPGATPVADFAPVGGLTTQASGDTRGEEEHQLTNEETPTHRHHTVSDQVQAENATFIGADEVVIKQNTGNDDHAYLLDGTTIAVKDATLGITGPPVKEDGSNPYATVAGDQPHNNLPPELAVWSLVKE